MKEPSNAKSRHGHRSKGRCFYVDRLPVNFAWKTFATINVSFGSSGKFAYALEYALGVPKTFWLNLQANYDAEIADTHLTNI